MINEPSFELKGPDAIRSRMEEIQSRLATVFPKGNEFQKALDKQVEGVAPIELRPEDPEADGVLTISQIAKNLEMAGPITSQGTFLNKGLSAQQKLQVQALISKVAVEQGIDERLLKAVVQAESDFNPDEVSHTGAMGLMQLMPDTARELGVVDPFNPYQNLTGGSKYLKQMLTRFNGDTSLALAAYNAGPGAVKRAGGIPNIAETKNYVSKILGNLNR
jgi:soluble lytic murein transglycosylase-like protein